MGPAATPRSYRMATSGHTPDFTVTDEEVARSRARDRAAQRAGWQHENQLPQITPDGKCSHCGAGKAHLYLVTDNSPSSRVREYQCRTCAHSSYQILPPRRVRP